MQTHALVVLCSAAVVTGCASFSPDAGFGEVGAIARERLNKDVAWPRQADQRESIQTRVDELLKQPLGVEDAVQIALLNNRGLQASFDELGIAEADRVQAGRLPNPGFSFARLRRGDEVEIERGVHFSLMSLLTLPLASRIEERRFEQIRLAVAARMLDVAADTRKAYFQTVAATETAKYMEQVTESAETAAELARRMRRAGNVSQLTLAREEASYAETLAQLARARQAAVSHRERLTRLMGLWEERTRFALPDRLPDLPASAKEPKAVEKTALTERLDVQMAKRQTEALARSLGLTRVTRFVNVLDFGYQRNSETGEPRQTGYEISFELPLFDFGTTRVAKAEALYMQAFNRAAETAINARSEARDAYLTYRTSYDLTKHYRDEIVPLRKRISDENLLRYNAMQIGVFELLADSREQVASVSRAIEALRDFWLAESDLQMALSGTSPGALSGAAASAAIPAEAPGGGH